MQNSKISFTSKINFTTKHDFYKISRKIKHVVGYPWTEREILKANEAYTTGIGCCSAGGAITNGKDITMFHIEPTKSNLIDFPNIIRTLTDKIGRNNKKLQGLLIGSIDESKSKDLFENFKSFMEKNNIPYSKFEKQKSPYANTDILYNASTDEWFITSDKISEKIKAQSEYLRKLNKEELQKHLFKMAEEEFEYVELAPFDELSFIQASYY